MSLETLTETEVKIRVTHLSAASVFDLLHKNGLRVAVPRLFESNSVYDTAEEKIRAAQMLLRLRQVGDRNILTWKGPAVSGPHKSRPEIETGFQSFEALQQILTELGYSVAFRYEKFRTEFAESPSNGVVVFDETPIGNFLELEGRGPWIDDMARRLGFSPADYILDSYGKLYLAYCREMGLEPSHMTFPSYTK